MVERLWISRPISRGFRCSIAIYNSTWTTGSKRSFDTHDVFTRSQIDNEVGRDSFVCNGYAASTVQIFQLSQSLRPYACPARLHFYVRAPRLEVVFRILRADVHSPCPSIRILRSFGGYSLRSSERCWSFRRPADCITDTNAVLPSVPGSVFYYT
jgi:hypothetical protein